MKAVVVYGDVYSADELSYYVNYAPYWCNSAAVVTPDELYMVTGHNNRVNPWIETLTGIEEEKLLASGFQVPVRTAESLKKRYPEGGRIGIIGKYVLADLADAMKAQGCEPVVMEEEKAVLMPADTSYRDTAARAAAILRQAFACGEEDYAQGGTSKTVSAEIEYAARKNGAMDMVLYVSHKGNEFGLPVVEEDAQGKWTVFAVMQYLGVWVSLTKTFGADLEAAREQLAAAAAELEVGKALPKERDGFTVRAEQVVSDVISDLNRKVSGIAAGQVLSVTVYDAK